MTVALALFLLAGLFSGYDACGQGAGLSEELGQRTIDYLDLREVPLVFAIRLLNEETGINIVATDEAMQKPVTVFIQNITVAEAIKTLCKCHGMWYREDEESRIVRIMTLDEYQKDLVVFREEMTKVFTLLHPNSVDIGVAIRDVYGKRVVLSLGKEGMYDEQYELERRFNRLDLLDERGQFSSRNGRTGNGSGSGMGGYGYGSGGYGGGYGGSGYGSSRLGMMGGRTGMGGLQGGSQQGYEYKAAETDARLDKGKLTPEQAALAASLEKEGTITGEAAIEAGRILKGQEAPIYVTVIMRNNQVVVRTGDAEAMNAIEELVTRLDVPTPQVLLEVHVLSVTLSDQFDSVFDLSWSNKNTGRPNPKNINVGGGDPSTAGDLVNGSGGFLYQFLDSKLKFRLQALEDEGRVTSIAKPMLMVANNEVSKVFVGDERPIVTGVHTETRDSSIYNSITYVVPETEVRNVGTTLLITPNINSDRSVTLRILQENSGLSDTSATVPVSTSDGTVTGFDVDVVETRQVTGTVVAKDGLTIAIGGLIEESIRDDTSGIPILKDIPILGILFGNTTQLKTRRELVVLIRPHVVITPEEAEKVSRERLEALSIHPYRYGKESLNTFTAEEVPGQVRPGPSWAQALRLHQMGVFRSEETAHDHDNDYETYETDETYDTFETFETDKTDEADEPVEELEPVLKIEGEETVSLNY
ncbi:MAG: hypothetical protein ABIK28_01190 [Planctomycetota bacterium]